MTDHKEFTLDFSEIRMSDLARVGGKNASLGEMFNALKGRGVGVVDGFAPPADAYRQLLFQHGLESKLRVVFAELNVENVEPLASAGHAARAAVLETPLPTEFRNAILQAYGRFCIRMGGEVEVAVRSSATAEDLPEASFAGQAETLLNVRGKEALIIAIHNCFASLFTDRAISYRARLGAERDQSHIDRTKRFGHPGGRWPQLVMQVR